MKKAEKNPKVSINQFDFIITPLEITFQKTEAQSYAFQLCKGAQVYTKFSEIIWVHAQERSFKFVNKESVELKIQNERGLGLEWSIYNITDDDLKQYYTSIPFDLSEQYNSILTNLNKGDKLSTILLNNKENKSILKDWNSLKNRYEAKSNYHAKGESGITVSYSVEIKYFLDYIAEEEHKLKIFKAKSRSSSSRLLHDVSRSFLEEEAAQNKDRNGEKEDNVKKASFQPNISINSAIQKNEVLSDIIQASNQCSSMYHGEKGTKINPNIEQILEVNEEHSPTFKNSTKTHDFDQSNFRLDDNNNFNKKSRTLRESSDNSFVSAQEDKEDFLNTAAPSGITEPSKIVPPNGNKISLVHKALLVLVVVVVILSTLYFFDIKGVKSQGILNFSKNVAIQKKASKMTKKEIKILDSKGKKKEALRKSDNADSQKVSRQKKTKVEEKTMVKKDGLTNNTPKLNKKVAIFDSLWNYLRNRKQDGKKKSNSNFGSWLSSLWRSKGDQKKKNDEKGTFWSWFSGSSKKGSKRGTKR